MNNAIKTEKQKPLTEKQESVFEKIRSTKGGHLIPYRKRNNDLCWKLMDDEYRPIMIFGEGIINAIIEKGYLIKQDRIITIK